MGCQQQNGVCKVPAADSVDVVGVVDVVWRAKKKKLWVCEIVKNMLVET